MSKGGEVPQFGLSQRHPDREPAKPHRWNRILDPGTLVLSLHPAIGDYQEGYIPKGVRVFAITREHYIHLPSTGYLPMEVLHIRASAEMFIKGDQLSVGGFTLYQGRIFYLAAREMYNPPQIAQPKLF